MHLDDGFLLTSRVWTVRNQWRTMVLSNCYRFWVASCSQPQAMIDSYSRPLGAAKGFWHVAVGHVHRRAYSKRYSERISWLIYTNSWQRDLRTKFPRSEKQALREVKYTVERRALELSPNRFLRGRKAAYRRTGNRFHFYLAIFLKRFFFFLKTESGQALSNSLEMTRQSWTNKS